MSGSDGCRCGRRWLQPAFYAAAALAVAVAGNVIAAGNAAVPLTAEQIVEKNVAARGGLDAWRKIDSMVWVGHMESADPSVPRLSFSYELKRPNKTRFELSTLAEKSVRVFDGKQGWNIRPKRGGALDEKPYTPQDLAFAREAQGFDGPLIDYRAKGIAVELAGIEKVEGHKAYRLHVRLPSGTIHSVWIDAKNFLDLKYDRTSYGATGSPVTVSVLYRNYQRVEGLQIPGTLEIGGDSKRAATARMVIDKISLNPTLDDKVFGRPDAERRKRAAFVDIVPPGDPRNAFGPSHAPPGPESPLKPQP
ncbi:MAG: LolA-like protein [Steroidobacteraceae bacterium]